MEGLDGAVLEVGPLKAVAPMSASIFDGWETWPQEKRTRLEKITADALSDAMEAVVVAIHS